MAGTSIGLTSVKDDRGSPLGDLTVADLAGRNSLRLELGARGEQLSIEERNNYALAFAGTSIDGLSFGDPVQSDPLSIGEELRGYIRPLNALGIVRIEIKKGESIIGTASLRVRSEKMGAEEDYQQMLRDICAWKTSVALDLKSSVSATWNQGISGPRQPDEILAVVRWAAERHSLLDAVQTIERGGIARLKAEKELVPLGRGKLPGIGLALQLGRPSRRCVVPESHPLHKKLGTLPLELEGTRHNSTANTPENRFVKFVLQQTQRTLASAEAKLDDDLSEAPLLRWSSGFRAQAAKSLHGRFFRDLAPMSRLPMASAALQRLQAYKSVLAFYLSVKSSLATDWDSLDEILFAETRNIAALYEYWCLIQVVGATNAAFGSSLDLQAQVTSGKQITLSKQSSFSMPGSGSIGDQPLNLALHYNRTFSPSKPNAESDGTTSHSNGIGTWSKGMRPDFTLAVWSPLYPNEGDAAAAGKLRLIHLDAKFKLSQAAAEPEAAKPQPDDLDKMHAYVAGINHSVSAVALYPGAVTNMMRSSTGGQLVGALPMRPHAANGLSDFLEAFVSNLPL